MKYSHVGLIIKRDLFDRSELTLEALADKVGCSGASLSRLFSGKASLSYEMAVKLEKVWPDYVASHWLDYQTRYELERLTKQPQTQ